MNQLSTILPFAKRLMVIPVPVAYLPLGGMPIRGITIDRIAGGKIVETWTNFDNLGMLQQLGVIPSMG